jgi:cbb3-type cytochrome oxidase subunit 3
MRDKVLKYAFWIVLAAVVLWAFDTGMKKQHEIDCAQGRYCGV